MAKTFCPRCARGCGNHGPRQIEVAKIEGFPGPNGELVWKCLCPECGAQGLFPDQKQRQCPHCNKAYTEATPYRAAAPGL